MKFYSCSMEENYSFCNLERTMDFAFVKVAKVIVFETQLNCSCSLRMLRAPDCVVKHGVIKDFISCLVVSNI